MIYFVDEDVNEMIPFAIELENRGYPYKMLSNADEGFVALVTATDVQAIILDVMLATEEKTKSRFDSISTNNFVTTGLVLLDDLVEQYKSRKCNDIPKKVVIFSAAQRKDLVGKIEDKAAQYGISYLDKKDYDDTYSFAEKLEEIMKNWS